MTWKGLWHGGFYGFSPSSETTWAAKSTQKRVNMTGGSTSVDLSCNFSRISASPVSQDICRICHCEGDDESPLITPCHCTGSLRFVHQACLQQWIKSSDTKGCELCKYKFLVETRLKPLHKWKRLKMTREEKNTFLLSVTTHFFTISFIVMCLYVIYDRTVDEVTRAILGWHFWISLVVMVILISCAGGLVFTIVPCRLYTRMWRKLKAYNQVIYVQNRPDTRKGSELRQPPLGQEDKNTQAPSESDPNTDTEISLEVVQV